MATMTMNLGPWALPITAVALLLGLIAAEATAAFLSRRGLGDAGSGIWIALLVALLGARAAFVIRFWSSYRLHPWEIIDLRDRGLSLTGAIVALALATMVLAWRKPAWRRALPASLAVGVLAFALTGVAARQLQAGSHPPLPQLSLRNIDGSEIVLTALAGKPTVINLWATWCPPCRREMPVLVDAQNAHPGVRFVFANQGESAATVARFLDDAGLTPRHVLIDGNSQLARYYRAPGYPTTVFLDAGGRLREIQAGPLSYATLQQHLQRLVHDPARSRGEVR